MQHKTIHIKNSGMQDFYTGNQEAFDKVFRELYPALCYYAFTITGDQAVSEDIAGEAFVKVWEKKVVFTQYLPLKSYLYTTVRNACIDWVRQYNSKARAVAGIVPLLEVADTSKFELLVQAETFRELHDAIKELPEQCRDVIRLSYFEGKSLKEVATELHIAVGSVKSQKSRGVLALRKRLKYFLSFFL